MADASAGTTSPLDGDAIARIDATQLPMRERHHLRLIAHCLASFQHMAGATPRGPLPSAEQQQAWIQCQPPLLGDPGFAQLLLKQFASAARQLEELAEQRQCTPLELTLEDLIAEAERHHRLRSS